MQWNRDGVSVGDSSWITLLILKNVEADKVSSANFRGTVEFGTKGDERLDGSIGDDVLAGADGNDQLVGGQGADILVGGNGDDTYFVDNEKDTVVEAATAAVLLQLAAMGIDKKLWSRLGIGNGVDKGDIGDDVDEVVSTVSFALTDFVENLSLDGSEDIDGTGNELDNILIGNSGDKVLISGTGALDQMAGGAGNDIYIVNNTSGRTVISDDSSGLDTLDLSQFAEPGADPTLEYSSGSGNTLMVLNSSGGIVEVPDFFEPSTNPLRFIDVGNGSVDVQGVTDPSSLTSPTFATQAFLKC